LGYNSKANGTSSIALGKNAVANLNNSIVLNASENILTTTTSSSLYVNPIRNADGQEVLLYNPNASEITHIAKSSFSSNSGPPGPPGPPGPAGGPPGPQGIKSVAIGLNA
jgi:hypothetical protein